MAIKFCEEFIFYDSNLGVNNLNNINKTCLIGIYKSCTLKALDSFSQKSFLEQICSKKPRRNPCIVDDVKFIALAQVNLISNKLFVKNVTSQNGYGPTLYALILQVAKKYGYSGVCPSQDPTKILDKPKEIWRQFSVNYPEQITLKPLSGKPHAEPWLNCCYELSGKDIIDLESMQYRRNRFLLLTDEDENNFVDRILMDMALDFGKASVRAYE